MKRSRAAVRGKARDALEVRFEAQDLTSFSGLIIFQRLFAKLGFKERLRRCFRHQESGIYGQHRVVLMLVVHLLLGFRELRDTQYYRDDEMVKRLLGLKHLPEVSTVSRVLAGTDERSVANLRAENRRLVLERTARLELPRITVDFDGSVQSTGRHAEGTAVGFNKQKKGRRSYYPLFATIAQTGQVLDVHHRPGNVHDSNGAKAFIGQCLQAIRAERPTARLETRMDSAFFSDAVVESLAKEKVVQFTVSVPFERFPVLKDIIEQRRRWRCLDDELSYFETSWKPKCWPKRYRFLFIRKRVRRQNKAPLQLNLFTPHEEGYDFKVIVTNKRVGAKHVIAFHEGRGAQEGIFAELKSHCHMDYVPVTTLTGNQTYLLAGLLAHNLSRELQMTTYLPQRSTTAKRTPLWAFEKLGTLQRKLIQRAGRLLRPAGKLVLSMNANETVENELLHYLDALTAA